MNRPLTALVVGATIVATSHAPAARAGDGDIAAGIIGGLAVGAIVGAAAASRPEPDYAPPPVYAGPPVYVVESCHWARGEPYWDGYRWRRPRIQVCD
jgi:hypothetical protein